MVAWFIIAIATLAIFAFIAVNGVQNVSAATDGVGRVETARKLDQAAAALVARAGSPNGTGSYFVLAGQTVGGVYGLPTELSSFATTSFGQRIAYCPFGGSEPGDGTATIPAGGSATYTVQTKADASGRVYVVGGRPGFPQVAENPNLLAFLVAPRTKASANPGCGSIRWNPNTRRFEAPDALVRAVIRDAGNDETRNQVGREVVFYVSQGGTGRGLAANDTASFQTALAFYQTRAPQAMRIVFAPGNYQFAANALNIQGGAVADKGTRGSLALDAPGGGVILDQNGVGNIITPGALTVRNVTFDSDTVIYSTGGNKVSLYNVAVGDVQAINGGDLYAENVTVKGQNADYALLVYGGSTAVLRGNITVAARTGAHAIGVLAGSRANAENAVITLQGVSNPYFGIMLDSSDFASKASTINVAAPFSFPFLVRGNAMLDTTVVATRVSGIPRIFELQGGGTLAINGGEIGVGTQAGSAIINAGGSRISGTTTLHAGACWVDYGAGSTLFSQSAPAAPGSTSAVLGDVTVPDVSDPPTAAQIQARQQAIDTNNRRAALRAVNGSSFACAA